MQNLGNVQPYEKRICFLSLFSLIVSVHVVYPQYSKINFLSIAFNIKPLMHIMYYKDIYVLSLKVISDTKNI